MKINPIVLTRYSWDGSLQSLIIQQMLLFN